MRFTLTTLLFLLISFYGIGQTATSDGIWQDNNNWNATYPGSGTDGDGTLNLDGETLNFDKYITLGSNGNDVNINVANSNFGGEFIVNDTLVIFGDVFFENKAMELTVTSNGVLIIFGDLEMNNQISVESDGVIVATGTFSMTGSTGNNDYSGGGNVYAGSYGGNAEGEIDASGDGSGDSSFTIDDLSTDGFDTIEEFVDDVGTTPLPVELLHFSAENTNGIHVSWATATEINNDYFSIERSEDGEYFYEIGRVEGNGDSNEEIDYSFTDKFIYSSVEYYRLKQVDFNGEFEYFDILRVDTGLDQVQKELSVFPTIIKDGVLEIASNQPFLIRDIKIYSLSGGESINLSENLTQQNQIRYTANLSNLNEGVYMINIITTEGDELNTRIIAE